MMVTIYKKEGETPLECLERLRVEQPEYKDSVLSYAGRLDPMAEGALLVLVDEENKEREKYLGLDKEYEVEVLFGVSTDTGDILGVVQNQQNAHTPEKTTDIFLLKNSSCSLRRASQGSFQEYVRSAGFETILQSFLGPFTQPYPHYSSKTVQGKPLFQWAREGRLDEIEIPERTVEIYDIELLDERTMNTSEILEQVKERIAKVKGDFRQKECLKSWDRVFDGDHRAKCTMVTIKVSCSSGTYMRILAQAIGKKLGTPALAWRIKRLLFLPN